MMSITKILMLTTAITAISGRVLDVSSDTVQPIARVSWSRRVPNQFQLSIKCGKIPEWKCRKLLSKANTTNTNSIVNQHGNQRERRQALVKTRNVDDGPGPVESFARSSYPLNVPRFQNGDVINYSTINMEVIKWIRQQLSIEKMNRIQEFKLKNLNRLSSSKTPQR